MIYCILASDTERTRSGRKGGIQQMKTIGFIDYYVSEWHANHYPIWIRELASKTGREYTVKYAWAEMDASPVDGRSTEDWCRDFGVEHCESLKELCEKSDAIVILAPSNPETHLGYAEVALRYGKPTYIDKTFAPDLQTAQEIFALARKYRTPVFSSSALRYATELAQIPQNAEKLTITAGGSNLAEYLVHPLGVGTRRARQERRADFDRLRRKARGQNPLCARQRLLDCGRAEGGGAAGDRREVGLL